MTRRKRPGGVALQGDVQMSAWNRAFGAAVLAASVVTGWASNAAQPPGYEARIGLLAHDAPIGGKHVEDGVDVHGEILFPSPAFLEPILAPRPNIGVDVNTSGDTSQIYAGLTWQFGLFDQVIADTDRVWIELGFGGAVHDGQLNNADRTLKALGSRVLFHESVAVGYDYLPGYNVSVLLDHSSNANLATNNAGITNIGMQLGFAF